MKEIQVEQGSNEWIAARLGLPTASNFEKIITPGGKLSTSSRKYACFLAAEKILNRQLESLDHLEWVQHGKMHEEAAAQNYEFVQDVKIRKCGFITTDDGRVGASPDRLIIGAKGGVEIKCPAPWTQIGYIVDGFGDAYKCQVQGQMWVSELDFVDRYAWHPELPPALQRTERDEPFIKLMSDAITKFCDDLDEIIRKARSSGFFEEQEKILTAVDQSYPYTS
ncbi:MAG TPA: YqaJ viral recombinase family protein [Candidatus Eisenbacteria bacterium]|nr:YqaJ viral recombinase family protein [Candidatus Eisenbacteria bacterium]